MSEKNYEVRVVANVLDRMVKAKDETEAARKVSDWLIKDGGYSTGLSFETRRFKWVKGGIEILRRYEMKSPPYRTLTCPADLTCSKELIAWVADGKIWVGCPLHGGIREFQKSKEKRK
jgi:hypothetical protein